MTGRRSLQRSVTLEGTGLHTGVASRVKLVPAPAGHGIAFRRIDLSPAPCIPASCDAVAATSRRTSLVVDGAGVETVEHLLAAIAAHQIDDLSVELDGPEPPALDGSAGPFFKAMAEAGTRDIGGAPVTFAVHRPITVTSGDASYAAVPRRGLRLNVCIEWSHPLIGRQAGSWDLTPETFARELAEARTFGFARDVEDLRARGLIRGADLSNAVVLDETGNIGSPLRWPDESVRHKSVDLLGDLALLGGRLDADVTAHRPSHAGNVALVRALRDTQSTGAAVSMGIEDILKILPHRYPMLLVDRILEIQGNERIVGLKNVSINEPFFQGHFPGHPVMPGVLVVEAMAQAGGCLLMRTIPEPDKVVVYFLAIDGVRFRRPVVPGDQLRFEVETVQIRGRTVKMKGKALVDGKVAAEAEFMAQIVDR